jgi:DNA polymerase (family 10)
MPIVNADIAAVFGEIADLLELQGANPFRIRAYRNAARTLGELGRSVRTMLERGEDLDALPGIGPDLAGKIAEVVNTGSCAQLERLRRELPPGITALQGLDAQFIVQRPHPLGAEAGSARCTASATRRSS